jgi:hypothetical protein
MDAVGNERIVLKVARDGAAEIDFLNEDGKVVKVVRGDDVVHVKSEDESKR